MAQRIINLLLQQVNFLQAKQVDDTAISSAYNQQEQAKQPKVLHQVNCVPLEHGLKSAALFDSDIVDTLYNGSNTTTPLLGPGFELTYFIDNKGNMWYGVVDNYETDDIFTQYYMRNNTTSNPTVDANALARYATIVNQSGRYEFSLHTLFQGRHLFLAPPAFFSIVGPDPAGDNIPDFTANAVYSINTADYNYLGHNLTGISLADIKPIGMTSYENYLIVYNRNRIYYSSPLDFTNFTPGVGVGGSAAVSEARGDILAVVPSPNGFMILCKDNVVVARFSGNTESPFIFNEIPNSTGVITYDGQPLVTKNESAEIQVAYLQSGLSILTEDSVQSVPDSLDAFINADYLENRVDGTGRLIRQQISSDPTQRRSKVLRMYSFGTKLFVLLGYTNANEAERVATNRLVYYDFSNGTIGWLNGDYRAVCPRITDEIPDGSNELNKKPSFVPDSYVLVKVTDIDNAVFRTEILDFGSMANTPVVASPANPVAEFLVGNIAINYDFSTVLYAVKLEGRLDRVVEEEGGNLATSTTKVRVFAYSAMNGKDSLVEFIYNPADETYYGYIEGKDIRVLVQGNYFYLTGSKFYIDRGGRL